MWLLLLKIVAPLLLVAGIVGWWSAHEYRKGFEASEAKMARYVAIQKKAVTDDVKGHESMTDDQLDAALKKKCREAGGSEEACA